MLGHETIQSDLDAVYAEIGSPATYNGSDITVACWRETGLHDSGDFVRETAECRVRKSDIHGVISKGSDTITHNGVMWLVNDVSKSDGYEYVFDLVRDYSGQL